MTDVAERVTECPTQLRREPGRDGTLRRAGDPDRTFQSRRPAEARLPSAETRRSLFNPRARAGRDSVTAWVIAACRAPALEWSTRPPGYSESASAPEVLRRYA